MSEKQTKYPYWQGPYEAALSESGSSKMLGKIHAAEGAIYERLQNMAHDSSEQNERQAIADALSVLRKLQQDKLSFPDWTA